jgi:serine/threonine-protein kinase SRPK3/serine/threonine-protein kinase SRPK1
MPQPGETNEEYTESDDEGAEGYRKGGYHVVTIGEVYNGRYRIIAKLGWGHFSTVWLCQDMNFNRFVAMKVQKSAPHYTEAAYDEIELLAEVAKRGGLREWDATQRGPNHDLFPMVPFTGVVQLVDYFEHYGPNGKHVCMVFETMGPNVLALIKRFNFKGVPLQIVRKVAAHTLIGLDYLHRICGIIHTDLKPENVLVACPKGVPVNKYGVPLVGNVDPALVAAKRNDPAMVQKALDMTKAEKKKAQKKKLKEGGEALGGEDDGVEAAVDLVEGVAGGVVPLDGGVPAQAWQSQDATQQLIPGMGDPAMALGPDGNALLGDPLQAPMPLGGLGRTKAESQPYMKNRLRPSRSDPTLLSSFGDDMVTLTRPLYQHVVVNYLANNTTADVTKAAQAAVAVTAAQQAAAAALRGAQQSATASKTALPEQATRGPPETQVAGDQQVSNLINLDQKLIEEVVSLDLFDHDSVSFKVADLGNACWIDKHFSDDIQTRQYRSPETIIGGGYDTSADIWSLACMIFELVTGDYLFDPKASEEYPRDEDHLALFVELLGPMPAPVIARGRRSSTYFNRRGELRHIKSLRYWGLEDVLQQKYHMPLVEAKALNSFLGVMLKLNPEDRASAQTLLQHPWLRGLPCADVPEAAHTALNNGMLNMQPLPANHRHHDSEREGGRGLAPTEQPLSAPDTTALRGPAPPLTGAEYQAAQ